MKNFKVIKDILKGICIGAGAILPGISSGVLCVIFGIYDKLVESVLGLFRNFKKNFLFLLPLGIGSFIGIILFGNILKFLFETYPMQIKYAFIGLILGSIPLLTKKIHHSHRISCPLPYLHSSCFWIRITHGTTRKLTRFYTKSRFWSNIIHKLSTNHHYNFFNHLWIFHVNWHCCSTVLAVLLF